MTNYITAITFLFVLILGTQSCVNDESVTISGNINVNQASFTIIDNSENSKTFGDLIASSDRASTTVDANGDFDITFTPSGDLTAFTYTYGVSRSTSMEIPINIGAGVDIGLGNLIVEEPVQVKFSIPDFMYVNEDFVGFTTFSENGFEANTVGDSEVGGILRGYLYENQLNSVKVFQRNANGEEVSETYEFNAEDLSFDEVIELK